MSLILRYLCLKIVKNKAHSSENIPTLHQSRYLNNVPTDFSGKLQAVRVRILFDIRTSFRLKNRNQC